MRGDEIPRSGAVRVVSAPLSDARIDAGLLVVSPALLPGAVPIGQAACARPIARRDRGLLVGEEDAVAHVVTFRDPPQRPWTVESAVNASPPVPTKRAGTRRHQLHAVGTHEAIRLGRAHVRIKRVPRSASGRYLDSSCRKLRGISSLGCLTGNNLIPRVPDAPSTERPRLMALRSAVASAAVSREAGRRRHRLGAFLLGSGLASCTCCARCKT
jgi:hypothetical protein